MQHSQRETFGESEFPSLITSFKKRGLALIVDDFATPSRGTIVAPAEMILPETVNEALTISKGITFVAMSPDRVRTFMLSPMRNASLPDSSSPPASQEESAQLAMCESVEAREGVTTGISASDRAKTIGILGERNPSARKLVRPGHIFPVEVKDGGVLVKNALPEAAHDIAVLSGFTDAALFIDVLNSKGEFASRDLINEFSTRHRIPLFSLSRIIRYRLETENLVQRVAEAKLPTRLCGEMRSFVYRSVVHDGEHVALVKGAINPENTVLTRVHTEQPLGDVFGGTSSSSRRAIDAALSLISAEGSGIFLYLRKPALTGSPHVKEETVLRQPKNHLPSSMMREYGIGAQILRDLGVKKVSIITGSKKNLVGLQSFGIEIVSQREIPSR